MEKLKERQKLEAHKIVEYEIKQQILRREQVDYSNKEKLDLDD